MDKVLKINGSHIKNKIIFLALFSTLIPLLVVGPFTFTFLNKIIENKVSTTVTNLLTIADWNIDTFIADIEDISNMVFLSNDIQGYLAHNKVDPKLYMLETSSMNALSNITVVNKPYINSIYIGNEKHGFLKVNQGESHVNGNIYSLIKDTTLYRQLLDSPWKGLWLNGHHLKLSTEDEQPLLFGRIIRNIGTQKQTGILLISIDQMIFEDMFNEVNNQGNILVLDGQNVLYSRNKMEISPIQISAIIDGAKDNGTIIKYINGKKNILNYHTNESTNWKIVSLVPYESVVKEVNQIGMITITLLVLSLIISIISAFYISNRITKQLRLLRLVTNQMEKSETISGIHFNKDDEIGKIGNRFVELYNRNNELISKLYEARVKEKEAELLALQSHINPHFLYNTLNAMYWMAEKSKAKPIAKMAISLSKIFKLTLNDGNPITTVKNEIEQVKNYLDIQNIRFDHKIIYHIEVDPSILDEKLIKLLLQPVVENAVYHGLEPNNGKGSITIECSKQRDCLLFKISDTGKGFNMSEVDIETKGYALKNIKERLKLHYGDEFGLNIDSSIDEGTTVTLKVGLKY